MELTMPESQFQVFMDEVRLPADALVGAEDAALAQVAPPARKPGTHHGGQCGRHGPARAGKATDYVKTRQVWKTPIGGTRTSHIRWRRTTSNWNSPG